MNTEKNSVFSVRGMVVTAMFAALICVAAPFSVYIGPIPISLATFAVYLTGSLLGAKRGAAAAVVYILIGAAGLPVFSGFSGGFAKLLGPTGGYIIGYIPLVFVTGLFADMNGGRRLVKTVAGMIAGTALLYTFGTVWFVILTKASLQSAMMSCVVPFLAGDALKIVCVAALSVPLRSRLRNYLNN